MEPFEIVQCLFVTLLTVGAVVNPLTLIGIWRSKKEQQDLWKPLLLSIYIGNMIAWIILCPISLYVAWTSATRPSAWLVRIHAQYMLGVIGNLLSVTFLALLQTISLLLPMRFSQFVTIKTVWISVCVSWLLATANVILSIAEPDCRYFAPLKTSLAFKKTYATKFNAVTICIMLFIMTICHLITFGVVVKQQIKMRSLLLRADHVTNPIIAALKSAKRILAITLSYMILYLPSVFVAYLPLPFYPRLAFSTFWMAVSQTFWTCMFYLAFSKDAWQGIKSLFVKQNMIVGPATSAATGVTAS